nr:MAG TPA: hypothetical protein [Caudoviricetes sp.]
MSTSSSKSKPFSSGILFTSLLKFTDLRYPLRVI